jgi:hypothetical protein
LVKLLQVYGYYSALRDFIFYFFQVLLRIT